MASFYAQYGEDRILAKLFPQAEGTCIEVGANDGIKFSNTLYFERMGWKCILIEPTPELCALIRRNRNAILFECAASEADGLATFHIAEGADLYSSLEVDSTMAAAVKEGGHEVRDVQVRMRPLDDILDEVGVKSIDFMTIDVEGHEMSVLRGFSIARWMPRIVLVEDCTDTVNTPVVAYMSANGYCRFYRKGGNDWYASPQERRCRNLFSLALSRDWEILGLAKAWLPLILRRPLILAARKLRG